MADGMTEYKEKWKGNLQKIPSYRMGIVFAIIGVVFTITGIGATLGLPMLLTGCVLILVAKYRASKLTKSQFNIKLTPKRKKSK